ncbi:hypothetical protein X769_18330 [Mesorhizobium sp. LSJC268A00]|nr:hypothetical protein X769_18330 [Mesorhizobium sp. LSJC268A00]
MGANMFVPNWDHAGAGKLGRIGLGVGVAMAIAG